MWIIFCTLILLARAQSTILLPSELDDGVSWNPAASASRCPAPDPNLNYRPVIGIVSHPGDGASGRLSNATNASNIPASYVKFVESAGARVIPLIYNEPKEVLLEKLKLVNGVLYTGGWAKTGLYYEMVETFFKRKPTQPAAEPPIKTPSQSRVTATKPLFPAATLTEASTFSLKEDIGGGSHFSWLGGLLARNFAVKKALERNNAGDHFPVYAICLGFELLSMIVSKDRDILESFGGRNQASTLQFTNNTNIEGTVFQKFPSDLLKKLSTDCLVLQNHRYGISPKKMQANQDLSSFFKILTTSTDENNEEYVSTVQAYKYPVTGFQWHPEKNAFEWGLSGVPHTEDAIRVTQNVANYLVSEARKSTNRPPARQVLDNLIYNYSPTYGGKAGKGYDEVYIFT